MGLTSEVPIKLNKKPPAPNPVRIAPSVVVVDDDDENQKSEERRLVLIYLS